MIVELVSEDREQRTFVNKTTGTVRQDLLGGESQQYHGRPTVKVESPLVEKVVPAEVGKVVSQDETKRTIELVSGTVRTDHR